MKMNWFSSNNVLNSDFGIFSSYADAMAKRNPWRFCNYNDPGVGFPRDCGPTGYVAHQWNAFTGSRHVGNSRSVAYYVHGAAPVVKMDWVKLLSNGAYGAFDVGAAKFNDVFKKSGDFVIKRVCSNCNSAYRETYYRRYTSPTAFAPYDYMKMNWFSRNNVLNTDFGIFSSYDDAMARRNPWRFCNYDDPGVGFPRDCGPTGYVAHQWNAFTGSRHVGSSRSVAYYIHGTGSATNMLPNGDFELGSNGREPTDWMRYGSYGNTGLRSSEQAHSGSHSIKYTGGSWQLIENGPSDSASRLNLKNGQAYKLTFWARSTASSQNIRTEFLNYPVTGSKSHYSSQVYTSSGSFVKTHHTSAANTWQQFTHTFTPSRDQPIVRLNIGPHGVSGSLYIDDVVLSPA
jgi:hypothetical protein